MTEPGDRTATDAQDSAPPSGRAGPLRRLYDWTIHWAQTPHALCALFLLALAEASFFPIPPDVLLIAMALAAPRKSLRYASVCLVGSVLGGCVGYAIGMFFFDAVGEPLLRLYGYLDEFHKMSAEFARHGFLFIFIAALTPIPYKVFTIAAGFCRADVSFGVLVAASVVGRGLRFYAVGMLFRLAGPPIKRFIDRYFNLLTIAFAVLLVLGFVCVKLFTGHANPGETAEGRTGAMLSESARNTLLGIARQTVEAVVEGEPVPRLDIQDADLSGHQGAFVTLKTDGNLRGCIGRFVADQPLWRVVQDMAQESAANDPRFFGMPLRPEELPDLHIEISVLSPLRRVRDPLTEVELGTHGIYIRQGFRSGCFLPQVATETGWSKLEFLRHCCAGKAGLSPDAWKDPQTEVFVFTAEVIGEP